MQLKQEIPSFYHNHLPQSLLDKKWIEIDKCKSCIMACGDKPLYRNDLKCCTYYPFVPNYQVGEMLLENAAAKTQVEQMIKKRQFVLPIGLCAPESYQQKFSLKKKHDFGNDKGLLCPFYNNGQCSTWHQRTSECISFQCYSSYGEKGLEFWQILGEVIHKLELYLSQELMLEKGYLWPEVEGNLKQIKIEDFSTKEKFESSMSAQLWTEFWQHQKDRIDNYFVECYNEALKINTRSYLDTLGCYQQLENFIDKR